MFHVVLVEPQNSGNVGSIARAMKNFGLRHLHLVNPKCRHLNLEAVSRAKHAGEILRKAKVMKKFDLSGFNTSIATTAALGTDSNVARIPLAPDKLAKKVRGKSGKTALVFGRDSTGLTNAEILKCDFVVTIPASVKYRALNLSHAAAILFYELSKGSRMKKISGNFVPVPAREKEVMLNLVDALLVRMQFRLDSQREIQRKVWRRFIGKAMLSRREAFAVIGFLKKVSVSGKQR